MNFPDGTLKEGYFENNVYKIKVQISGNQKDEELKDEEVKSQMTGMNASYDGGIAPSSMS